MNPRRHADAAAEAFGGAPCGATKRVKGVLEWAWGPHAVAPTETIGGAPYRAANRVKRVPEIDMRTESRGRERGGRAGSRYEL